MLGFSAGGGLRGLFRFGHFFGPPFILVEHILTLLVQITSGKWCYAWVMDKNSFGAKALDFYCQLEAPAGLPPGIETMNPYKQGKALEYTEQFLNKYFADNKERIFVIGINPGRFGAGLTGVAFTDPTALAEECGIENDLDKRREISAEFVYKFINHWGGADKFYEKFFVTAVCPLGFMKEGINYNYYDEPALFEALKPFIVSSIQKQLEFGARRDVAILVGAGKNLKYFEGINKEYGFFDRIITVDHPRFIMQYKRKYIGDYLDRYKAIFEETLKQEIAA